MSARADREASAQSDADKLTEQVGAPSSSLPWCARPDLGMRVAPTPIEHPPWAHASAGWAIPGVETPETMDDAVGVGCDRPMAQSGRGGRRPSSRRLARTCRSHERSKTGVATISGVRSRAQWGAVLIRSDAVTLFTPSSAPGVLESSAFIGLCQPLRGARLAQTVRHEREEER